MDQMTLSRSAGQHAVSEQMSMRELLAAIMADEAMPLLKRRDMCSGVRSLCSALHVQIESTAADPRLLAKRMEGATPATVGMSKGRFQNCRSHLDAAFAWADAQFHRRRGSREIQPEFQELLDRVEEKFDRVNLRRLLHFLADKNLRPKDVDEEVFAAFTASLLRSTIGKALILDRETRKLWNRLSASVPGWPGQTVSVPSYVDHYVLPPDKFPSSLWADLDAYLATRVEKSAKDLDAILSDDELFGDAPPRRFASIRPSTANLVRYRVRQFASVLVLEEIAPPQELVTLACLVSPARVNAGLKFFIRRAEGKKENSQMKGIVSDLVMIAELWVRSPQGDISKLRTIISRVRPKHEGLPESARRSLAPFCDIANVRAFLTLPEKILRDAEKGGPPDYLAANRVAAALWIKIAQRAPLRISNLLATDLERNLIRTPGKAGGVAIYFPPDEVKNEKALEAPLSSDTIAILDRYLKTYRPLLATAGSSLLFPAVAGKRKLSSSMSTSIQRLMRAHIGFAINPHSFRHVAAKLYLSVHPGDYETVQRLLGHRRRDTTVKYYCDLQAEEAFRHFDAVLLGLQDETPARLRK